MNYLGDFPTGATVYVPFHTFNSSGASVTLTGLAVTDIEIYKDGGTTQRSSDAGYTLLDTDGIDFDGITGIHGFKIDLSDNTDAGFYAAAHDYFVVVSAVTVDSQTVNFVACSFSIENRSITANVTKWLGTAAATPTTAGVPEIDVTHWNGTAVASPATAGYPAVTLKVGTGTGEVNLASGKAPATIAAGDIANSAITAASIAADAITDAKVASDVTIASVTGAVGSVTGNVGGNVTGSVGSVVGAVGSVTGNVGGNVVGSVATATALGSGAVNATSVNTAGANWIADHVIRRSFANAKATVGPDTKTFRSLLGAIARLVNKNSISAGTLTVTEEDDSTSLGTAAVTTTAGNPISSIDPT